MFDLIIRILITVVLVAFGAGMITIFVVMLRLAWEDFKKNKEDEQ